MADRRNWFDALFGQKKISPNLPPDVCVYAVGDIHGRFDLLQILLDKIWRDADSVPQAQKILVFVGDYVDRGPSSKDVVDFLITLEKPGWDIVKLMGNHEFALLEFLQNPDIYPSWRTYGGAETLLSYGVKPPMFSDAKEILRAHEEFLARFPEEHKLFFSRLDPCFSIGSYYFVHAGIRPGVLLENQTKQDLFWIRDEFLLSDQVFDKIIIHGHTPSEEPVVRHNRIGIDTGAYATNRLSAVKLSEDKYSFFCSIDT